MAAQRRWKRWKQETQTSVCPLHQLQGERFGLERAGDADKDETKDEDGERVKKRTRRGAEGQMGQHRGRAQGYLALAH